MTTCWNLNTEERGRTAESRPFLEKSLAFLLNDAVNHRQENEKRKVGSRDARAVAESSGRVVCTHQLQHVLVFGHDGELQHALAARHGGKVGGKGGRR